MSSHQQEGIMQISKGGMQPTDLLSYDTFEPQQQLTWHHNSKGAVVTHLVVIKSFLSELKTHSARWKSCLLLEIELTTQA